MLSAIIVLLGAFPIKTVVMAVVGNSEMGWPCAMMRSGKFCFLGLLIRNALVNFSRLFSYTRGYSHPLIENQWQQYHSGCSLNLE